MIYAVQTLTILYFFVHVSIRNFFQIEIICKYNTGFALKNLMKISMLSIQITTSQDTYQLLIFFLRLRSNTVRSECTFLTQTVNPQLFKEVNTIILI